MPTSEAQVPSSEPQMLPDESAPLNPQLVEKVKRLTKENEGLRRDNKDLSTRKRRDEKRILAHQTLKLKRMELLISIQSKKTFPRHIINARIRFLHLMGVYEREIQRTRAEKKTKRKKSDRSVLKEGFLQSLKERLLKRANDDIPEELESVTTRSDEENQYI